MPVGISFEIWLIEGVYCKANCCYVGTAFLLSGFFGGDKMYFFKLDVIGRLGFGLS